MRTAAITGTALVALLALAGCGGNDDTAESQEVGTEAPVADGSVPDGADAEPFDPPANDDPFEDIPDDAPIHDMESEEDIMRYMLDCDESIPADQCEAAYEDSVNQGMIEYDLEECHEIVQAGPGFQTCFSVVLPDDEFWVLYEETYGEPVPDQFR